MDEPRGPADVTSMDHRKGVRGPIALMVKYRVASLMILGFTIMLLPLVNIYLQVWLLVKSDPLNPPKSLWIVNAPPSMQKPLIFALWGCAIVGTALLLCAMYLMIREEIRRRKVARTPSRTDVA
ncbi:MAG: hypothetical protein ACT4QC_17195 [Planctomycetaceae bacterium]